MSAAEKVGPEQRFTHGRACPICGKSDDGKRVPGERCWGFISGDGKWAHCTHDGHAGRAAVKSGTGAHAHLLKGHCPCGTEHSPADPKPARGARARQVASYAYRDTDGALVFEVVRFDPKDFRQRRPDPEAQGGWAWNLKGVTPVPYRLPELAAADPAATVFIVEGEKDVEALVALGLVATCNAGGAGKWRPEFAEHLIGRHVVVLPDNDQPGRDHAESVAQSLRGKAASVKIVELPGLPEKGDAWDWIEAGGTAATLTGLVGGAQAWKPVGPLKLYTPEKPPIEVNTERHRVLAETLAALPRDAELFNRSGILSKIVRETEDVAKLPGGVEVRKAMGTAGISAVQPAGLSCRLTSIADFIQWSKDKNGEPYSRPVHPPDWLVTAVHQHGEYAGVRPLRSVAEAPFPRPDGTIVTARGYDAATAVFLSPSVDAGRLNESPTQEDALQAVELLFKVVEQFPFVGFDDMAAWLAGLLTVIGRPAIEGPVPGLAINGNRAGTGKGKLVDLISTIATGRECPTTAYPKDDAEAVKVRTSFALAGTPIVHLDNLTEGWSYGSGPLDSALTTMTVSDRILGRSETTAGLELRCCWFLSGNNVSPKKDAHRRWLVCNLVTPLERPEERDDIEIKDILGHVRRNRPALVRAALTILRAHAVAGWPNGGWAPLGSFEDWDRVVRGAVWFATKGLDCAATRRKAADDSEDRLNKIALLHAWKDLDGGCARYAGLTVSEVHTLVIRSSEHDPRAQAIKAALMQFSKKGDVPSGNEIGKVLRGIKGQTIEGMVFRSKPGAHGVLRWVVDEAN